ncbi:hypothetical protein Bca101_088801 [Brassica carinata]
MFIFCIPLLHLCFLAFALGPSSALIPIAILTMIYFHGTYPVSIFARLCELFLFMGLVKALIFLFKAMYFPYDSRIHWFRPHVVLFMQYNSSY